MQPLSPELIAKADTIAGDFDSCMFIGKKYFDGRVQTVWTIKVSYIEDAIAFLEKLKKEASASVK